MSGASESMPPRALAEWNERGAREYGSGAIAHHFTHWLMQLGASPDLVRAGLDVVEDELRHAETCRALVTAAGDAPLPSLPVDGLELPRRHGVSLAREVLSACLSAFCLNETTAVTMFREMRRIATVPAACAVIEEFLADEVRHREFGWVTLEWLLRGPYGEELRPYVLLDLHTLVAAREALFGNAEEIARTPPPTPSERAWGLLARGDYVEIFARTLARDVRPRLQRLGVSF